MVISLTRLISEVGCVCSIPSCPNGLRFDLIGVADDNELNIDDSGVATTSGSTVGAGKFSSKFSVILSVFSAGEDWWDVTELLSSLATVCVFSDCKFIEWFSWWSTDL